MKCYIIKICEYLSNMLSIITTIWWGDNNMRRKKHFNIDIVLASIVFGIMYMIVFDLII